MGVMVVCVESGGKGWRRWAARGNLEGVIVFTYAACYTNFMCHICSTSARCECHSGMTLAYINIVLI